MRTAVVYFSLEGSTKYVAEKVAKELDADLIPLVPIKKYPRGKISKYIYGGKSARSKEIRALEPYRFNSEDYGLIVLGTPMWAGTFTPPLRTFLKENELPGNNVGLFVTCSGSSPKKLFEEIQREMLEVKFITTLSLVKPLKKSDSEISVKINEFCAKLRTAYLG